MLKQALLLSSLLVLLLGGVVFYYFDALLKGAIEVVGTEVLGTSVTVTSVSVSPLNGRGSISGLRIENPQGFNADYVIELSAILLNINTSTVFSEVVEIESVTIVRPQITYETRITTDNIRTLLGALSSTQSSSSNAERAASGGSKRVIIRQLQILEPQLTLVAAGITAPISLPDIQLQNIGTASEATTVPAAIATVLAALSTSILAANLPPLDDLAKTVQDRLRDGVEQVEAVLADTVEELGSRLRRILN